MAYVAGRIVREAGLHAAARVLGVAEVVLLDFDPEVVVTLDPESPADHRDHSRVGAATAIAFRAASIDVLLYHWVVPDSLIRRCAGAPGDGGGDPVLEMAV